ncbi:hypothetical protein C8R44DRAFT_741937 [Mycena epipterygia]|nr:hypothetical protein C8R44DRAFT_741937 [Mycena epipterygia]
MARRKAKQNGVEEVQEDVEYKFRALQKFCPNFGGGLTKIFVRILPLHFQLHGKLVKNLLTARTDLHVLPEFLHHLRDLDPADHTSNSDIEILNTPPPKKKTKHSSRPSVDEDEPDDSVDMAFCVEVQTPPPPILAACQISAKAPPPKTTELGPYKFNSAKDYSDFLQVIAKACQTTTSNLDVVSMRWKFDLPNNSKPKPVMNKTGFDVMITTLLSRRKDYNFVILMAPPNAVKKELLWVKDEDDGNGGGPPLDFEYSLDDFTAGPSSVLSIRQQIAIFDLNDVKLRVWAVHMAKGTATVDKAPASNHFFKNQTIRPPSAFATVAALPPAFAPIAAVPNVAVPEPLMQLLLNMQMMNQINPLFKPALVPPYGHMQPQQAPPLPQYTPHPVQSTPLVLPREISLDEYFDWYKIDSEDQRVLKELGYVPGDEEIEELPKEVWEMTKVLPLPKSRILRQHAKFVKDVKNGLWD